MSLLLAAVLLGVIGSKIPSDADIAARIEEAIRAQLHPTSVTVLVRRRSSLSTTVEQLDITISGFQADQLPLSAPAPPLPTGNGKPKKDRQIRIVEVHVTCTDFTVNALPIHRLELNGRNVYLPWQTVKTGEFQIAAAELVAGMLVVNQQDLTTFLGTQQLPISNPQLIVSPEEVRVSGITRGMVKCPVQVAGRLTARNGAVLYLVKPHLKVSVVPMPDFITRRLLKDINPLADLNAQFQLPAPLLITNTVQQNEALRFEGALQFPAPEKN